MSSILSVSAEAATYVLRGCSNWIFISLLHTHKHTHTQTHTHTHTPPHTRTHPPTPTTPTHTEPHTPRDQPPPRRTPPPPHTHTHTHYLPILFPYIFPPLSSSSSLVKLNSSDRHDAVCTGCFCVFGYVFVCVG